MKRWLAPFSFLLIALVAAFYYQQRQAGGRTGFPAPDFALRDLQGHTHRLADYRGKIVFLNLWATWCPPCRMEMPSMEHLYRRLKSQEFAMLAVSEDDAEAPVRAFVNESSLSFPVLLDTTGALPPRYGVTGYPETFVIDRKGQVIKHFIGPESWESDQAYQYFQSLLAQPPERLEGAAADASRNE